MLDFQNPMAFSLANGKTRFLTAMKTKFILFCALAWMLHLTAFSQQGTNDYFKDGKAKLKANDLDGALTDFDKAAKLKPDDAKVFYSRGIVKFQKGDKAGAFTDIKRSIQINSNDAEAYVLRGLFIVTNNNFEAAVKDFDASTKNLVAAIKDYNKAIELDPTNSMTAGAYDGLVTDYGLLGAMKAESGDLDGGLVDINKAIEIQLAGKHTKYSSVAYSACAKIKTKKGDLNGALADYDKAIDINPNNQEAISSRGWLNRRMRGEKPADDIDSAYDPQNFNTTNLVAKNYLTRGHDKFKVGDWKGALDDFNKAIEGLPDRAGAYALRSLAKSGMGDLTGALSDLDKAIELEPATIPELYYGRSIVKKKKGDMDGALADNDRYLELKHDQILRQLQSK